MYTTTNLTTSLDFVLPTDREATTPAEARGLHRDQVRLLVSHYHDDRVQHSTFRALPQFLAPGDLLLINTSGTLKAALQGTRRNGEPVTIHLSTPLDDGTWVLEVRDGDHPRLDMQPDEQIRLAHGGTATLQAPARAQAVGRTRLWQVRLDLPLPLHAYLDRYGEPIRYRYVREPWPIAYYQTVYATDGGSAEMPSAGRAFTPELITRLVARGIVIAPLVLHTGVASLEAHEPPYAERYVVPATTAALVNLTRRAGQRVIAVGTTAVRAIETVADECGVVRAGSGWTDLVVTPARGVRVVDGLLTGFHDPQASHLAMLAAVAGPAHLRQSYAAALDGGYLWHEFGDLHLLLP